MLTLGTTAPFGSVTLPSRSPVVRCPKTAVAKHRTTDTVRTACLGLIFICPPVRRTKPAGCSERVAANLFERKGLRTNFWPGVPFFGYWGWKSSDFVHDVEIIFVAESPAARRKSDNVDQPQ